MSFQIDHLAIPDLVLLQPPRVGDERGWFWETFNAELMKAAGIDVAFVQDNHSFSAAQGTLRGLHFQTPLHAQDKLVRCSRGAMLDVAIYIRYGASIYGKWVAIGLTAENGRQLFVPKGFLHGFVTLQPKQLVPAYDKPMIYYPFSVLMLANIRKIAIITTPQDQDQFKAALGNGENWGTGLQFLVQPSPEGLAQAYLIADRFLEGAPSAILGELT